MIAPNTQNNKLIKLKIKIYSINQFNICILNISTHMREGALLGALPRFLNCVYLNLSYSRDHE